MTRLIIILCFLPLSLIGQTGGKNAFPFLDLPYNARAASLGRQFITAFDDDINTGVQNPASFNTQMDNSIGFNQALLAGGINHGMVAYAKDINKIGTGAIHLRYVAYGKMDRMDVNGEKLGTFSAGDFALGGSIGRTLNQNLSIGATFNLIWSQLEAYNSMGISLDLAGMYRSNTERTTVSAVVRNAGVQLSTYTEKTRAPLPIQAMLGVSHKLEHAPFRISILAHHLNKWDLTYNDPNAKPTTDPLTGELIPVERAGFGEKLGRHFIFQVETIIGKTVRIRAAFDYNQRREMLVQNRPGMGGFSFGAGLNFKRFTVDYGLYVYSSAGFNNLISLRTDFDQWRK
ncbi:MAG TPA: type IX secretion system protein PorQ [Brumimicrobium sp.]|nr:type IX secretion system protein PorQ [Brumimicrobium sp.]